MIVRALKKLKSVTGLITVPGTIALIIWLMAWPVLTLDSHLNLIQNQPFDGRLAVNYETAIAVLSTISSAAITTLSLVYSIVLVVFTLAAGNIAPRLLQRFTKDRVNQVTAGLLGGTFLYSLTIIHQTSDQFIPSVAITIAFILAAITVLQLIYFVHTVSQSVTIDEEIAAISAQLENRLSQIIADEDGKQTASTDFEMTDYQSVKAPTSGYLSYLDLEEIAQTAAQANTAVFFCAKPGSFLLHGQDVAYVKTSAIDHEMADTLYGTIQENCSYEALRGAHDDIEYAVNLLIEIALRALSPGVNDTFTAIACADRLSAAFQNIVTHGLRERVIYDEDGTPRVKVEGLNMPDLLNTAFNPLRRAAASNALMMKHLGDALSRLYDVANDDAKTVLKHHLDLLITEFEHSEPLSDDVRFLRERFSAYL